MEELGCKLSISLKWGCKGDVGDLRPISQTMWLDQSST